MPLTGSQLVAIAAVLADVPTLDLDALLAGLDSETYARTKAVISEVDAFDALIEKHRTNLIKVGLTDPYATDVAAVPGDPVQYGKGLWIHQQPVRPQADITSSLERRIVAAVRRAFTDVRLG